MSTYFDPLDEERREITCSGCQRVFKGKRALAGHRQSCDAPFVNPNQKPETCNCSTGPCNIHEADAW